MKAVGLTGGIGSGKSLIAKIFYRLGVPIYCSDERAKYLMDNSELLRLEIQKLFGPNAYLEKNKLNRSFISEIVFNDKKILSNLNELVHPAVLLDYNEWKLKHHTVYHIKESALLFETGLYKNSFKNILVTAPEIIRLRRVMDRDNLSEAQVKERMKNQWLEVDTVKLADFVIINDAKHSLITQVLKVHQSILFDGAM